MERIRPQVDAGKTPPGIWWGMVVGFLAWGLNLGISYVLEQHSCSTRHHYVLHVTSLICILLAFSGCITSFSEFRRLPSDTTEEGGSSFDRAHFQALLGIAFSLSFILVVIAATIPSLILNPCE